jgi:hypothetical protein
VALAKLLLYDAGGVKRRSAEFDGQDATVAAVEQAIEQGVDTSAFNSLRKAVADERAV